MLVILLLFIDQISSFPAKNSTNKRSIVNEKSTQPPFIGDSSSPKNHEAATFQDFITEQDKQQVDQKRHPNMNVHITKYSANRRIAEEIVSTEHVVHRVRRFYYDDAYPFYYENEFYYDYEDYLNPQVSFFFKFIC